MAGISHVAAMGNRVFAPLGLLTILTGLTLAWLGGWGFAAWTVLAAATVAGTFALGAAVLGPSSERCVRTWAETGDASASLVQGRRVLALVKLDLGAQFAIIALMVLKPGWTDPLLVVPAAFLALSALGWLRGASGPAQAQPA